MTDVLDVISREAQWLKVSRDELVAQLERARRVASRRRRYGRSQWQALVADMFALVDRSIEPMFDAVLAVSEFAQDLRTSCKRVLRRR